MFTLKNCLGISHVRNAILSCFLLLVFNVHAQEGFPIKSGTINLSIDADGKINVPPDGFSLIEGDSYTFKITAKAPLDQHKGLLKFFRDKINDHYQKVINPADSAAIVYSLLFSNVQKFQAYKDELQSLLKILDNNDPALVLNALNAANPSDFPHFHGRDFLLAQLFGKLHTLNVSVDGKTKSASAQYNEAVSLESDLQSFKVEKFNLEFRVNDYKKKFISEYYAQSRNKINLILDTLRSGLFYGVSVGKEVGTLSKYRKEKLAEFKNMNIDKLSILCTSNFSKEYQDFKTNFSANPFLRLISADWLLYWGWYTDSEIKLNPLDFTDSQLLVLRKDFDTLRAANRDTYVENSIIRMTSVNSDVPVSVEKFDSLNKEIGKGKEFYNFSKENELLKKDNAERMNQSQWMKTSLDSVTFRVIEKEKQRNSFIRTYDGANALMPSKKTTRDPISTKIHVEVMAYNLKSTQVFTLTPDIKDTEDNSEAGKQLDAIASSTSVLGTAAASAFSSIVALKASNKKIKTDELKIDIPAIRPSDPSGEKSGMNGLAPTVEFAWRLSYKNGQILFQSLDEHDKVEEEIDLWHNIRAALVGKGLGKCTGILSTVFNALQIKEPAATKRMSETAEGFDRKRQKFINGYIKLAETIAIEELNKIADAFYSELRDNYKALIVAELLIATKNYTIPPKEIKVLNHPGKPKYYNKFIPIEDQSAAKKVTLPLVLALKTDSIKPVTRTDIYKVSPLHYVTASLGLTYVTKNFRRSDVTIQNGVISNSPDEERTRLIAGLHFHLSPILLTNDKFIGKLKGRDLLSRFSVFLGVSFPKPLYNPHLGLTVEPWPSIRITGGAHFYRRTTHMVVNDQIADEKSKYVYNAPFIAVTIEPATFVKFLGSFIK